MLCICNSFRNGAVSNEKKFLIRASVIILISISSVATIFSKLSADLRRIELLNTLGIYLKFFKFLLVSCHLLMKLFLFSLNYLFSFNHNFICSKLVFRAQKMLWPNLAKTVVYSHKFNRNRFSL